VRLLARILVVAVAIAIGSWFVGRVMRPIKLVTSEQRDRDRIAADYKSYRTQNEDLRRQLHYLQTPRASSRRPESLASCCRAR